MKIVNYLVIALVAVVLTGCGGSPNRGRYYSTDRPPQITSRKVSTTATVKDAVPRVEKPIAAANKPYTVMGKRYVPVTGDKPMVQVGIGSWYGTKFHGKKTSIGETYNMYAMTAAHTTMELPSYARVTNLENGKSVIVRVNDRGPFLHDRVIDLSYAAATKLGYANKGTARVRVERITRAQIARGSWKSGSAGPVVASAAAPTVTSTRRPIGSRPIPAPAPAPVQPINTPVPVAEAAPVAAAPVVAATQTYEPPQADQIVETDYENDGEFITSDGSGVLTKEDQGAEQGMTQKREASGYAVQLGVFSSRDNAYGLARRANEALSGQSEARVVEVDGKYKVLVGGNMDADQAKEFVETVSNELGQKCVVTEDIN